MRGGRRTFDVSVDLLLRVEVVQTLQDLLQHGGDLGLIKGTRAKLRDIKDDHIKFFFTRQKKIKILIFGRSNSDDQLIS